MAFVLMMSTRNIFFRPDRVEENLSLKQHLFLLVLPGFALVSLYVWSPLDGLPSVLGGIGAIAGQGCFAYMLQTCL